MWTPLKRARKNKGITLEKVAELVQSDTGNLSRIERGLQTPSKELIAKLVELFADEGLTELKILFPERFEVPVEAISAAYKKKSQAE